MQEWNFAEIIVDHVPVPLYPYGTGTAVLVRVQYEYCTGYSCTGTDCTCTQYSSTVSTSTALQADVPVPVQGCSLKGNALLSQCGNSSSTGIQHDTEVRFEESVPHRP